ncbi:MAG: periplasmic heavy metal sensor [Chlorobium sp.]|nr:MAG: periplasmic heavy metal sensor [Chlorobium sp.]
MKKTMMMMMTALLIGFGTASAATDYSHASDEELAKLRGTMRNAPVEDRIAYHNEWQKRLAELGPDNRMQTMRMPGGRVQNCRIGIMQQQLGLNDKQSQQVVALQQKHFNSMAAERNGLQSLNIELQKESLKATPDRKKIEGLSEKIGKEHAKLARMRSSHIEEVASVLTPSQRDKMGAMFNSRPMRGNCGMRFQ